MKIIFMGTPDFAAVALKKLIESEHEIVLVVTQPDKPVGRKQELQAPDVKVLALEHGLEVYQPTRIRNEDSIAKLREYDAELFVVAAFGQILPKEILDMPKFGCINIHASLLPKYRGAAPIQWSVVNGDEYTGVTIQKMDIGVDTGDIVGVSEVAITSEDTGESMFDKLAVAGADLLIETIAKIENGTATYTPQNEAEATHVGKISKEMGELDFNLSAHMLDCKIRGLYSWPGTFTYLGGKVLKIWKAKEMAQNDIPKVNPGEIAFVEKDCFGIQTGDGIITVQEVQLEGKKRMPASDFLRGVSIKTGDRLGK